MKHLEVHAMIKHILEHDHNDINIFHALLQSEVANRKGFAFLPTRKTN